jgi:ATP-dependent Lon protease
MHPSSAEYTVASTYLDWITALPWHESTADNVDIKKAQKILDDDHYGLEKPKRRIIEYLAVRKLKPESKGPILCFAGPPGTGKTSLGQSIARASFIASPWGVLEMRLKSEVTGAPMWAPCPDALFRAYGVPRGDPSSALLEVLDPEQNFSFSDHYLDVPFDLSKVMFITTANILDTIPPALRDRMEVLMLHGYTLDEKVKIANRFLIPRQRDEHGIKAKQIKFNQGAVKQIITGYTREAGLRNLEREIAAWTPTGGELLFIEATAMKGKKGLTLTGQLGDVMKESATAALSFIRANAKKIDVDEDFFETHDLHIHVPAGAIPKDGPSAGVTMLTALTSLLKNQTIDKDLAMTGEITLRGQVLPVGGVKEKILAAHRAGIKEIILPEWNKKDLEDIPPKVQKEIRFHFVDKMINVLDLALDGQKQSSRKRRRKKT